MKALIFDCDGVLADTERDGHRVAFNRTFADYGIDFSWSVDDYAAALHVAGGKERIRSLLSSDFIARHQLPSDANELDRLVAKWHATKTRHFVALVEAGELPPRPGVRRLAAEAAAEGWLLAVASTSASESVRAVLTSAVGTELAERFTVCAGDDVKRKKPAPDIYALAAGRLVVDASEAVAIEDSAIGLQAGRAAGLPVIVTTSAYTAAEDFTGAAIVVDMLGEPTGPALTVHESETTSPIEDCITLAHLAEVIDRPRRHA